MERVLILILQTGKLLIPEPYALDVRLQNSSELDGYSCLNVF